MNWRPMLFLTVVLLTACGSPPPNTIRIEGVVVELGGLPVPGVRVLLPGHTLVSTDGDGRFTIDDVRTPYTLIIEQSDDEFWVFEALSRPDPHPFVSKNYGKYQQIVHGHAYGTSSGNKLSLLLVSENGGGTTTIDTTSNSSGFDLEVTLFQPVANGRLFALEWSPDASGNAQNFVNFAAYPDVLPLAVGGQTSPLSIDLSAVSATHDLVVNVAPPAGTTPILQTAGVRLGEGGKIYPIITYRNYGPASDQFTVRSPDLDAAEMLLVASYSDSLSGSIRWQSVPASTTSHTLTLPEPPELLDPADGAGIGTDAVFSWKAPAGSVSWVRFDGNLTVQVFTASNNLTLPNLEPFGVDYGVGSYTWHTLAFRYEGSLAGTVDQLVQPGTQPLGFFEKALLGSPASRSGFLVFGGKRSFSLH